MPRHADTAEGVADNEVTATRVESPEAESAVFNAYVDAGIGDQTELVAVGAHYAVVDLGDQAACARPGGGEIAREGETASAEVVGR